jgi:hypothetical protein
MALSNGTGGYQITAGSDGEAVLFVQTAPTSLAAAATATAAQLSGGLFVFNGTAGNLTLPTVADLEADISSAQKVNAAFDFFVVNTDAADAVTLAVGTGWTIVGAAAVALSTSAHFRARKTGDGTWTAYRIS